MPDKNGATRADAMARIFKKCCADGQVNELVLHRLEKALTKQQLSELCQSLGHGGKPSVDISQVPAEWKRHVVERDQSNSKRGPRRR